MRIREIIIIIGLSLSLVLFGVIALLDQTIDPSDNTNPVIAEKNTSAKEAMIHHMIDGLSSIDDSGKAYIHLDEYDINELLYSLLPKLNFGSVKARSIYIEERESGHRLCLPVQIFGFKTMLSGDISLYADGDDICARVSDIRVAKVPVDGGVMSGLKGLVLNMLKEQGIAAYFEGNTLNVRMTRENIGDLIANHYKDDPNIDLIKAMYSLIMLKTDSVTMDIVSPTDVTVCVDLGCFGMTDGGKFSGLNEYTEDLLSRGVIGKGQVALVSKYYVNGYTALTEEEQTEIKALLSGEADVDQLASYGGLVERKSISLTSLLLSQFDVGNSFTPGFKISDKNINDMLTSLPVIGTVWQLSSNRDGSCAYLAVSNVYCSISDDLIKINVCLEVNGKILTISVDFVTGESPLVAISGSLDGVFVGNIQLDEADVDLIFGFVCDHLQEGWIYAERESRTVTLDFTSAFSENSLLSFLLSSKNIVTSCRKSLVNDGGFINITFRLFG